MIAREGTPPSQDLLGGAIWQYKAELWGAYDYTPDKDVVRAPMTLGTLPMSVEELTWNFTDMSDAGGKLTIMWDKTVASVAFKVGS